MFGISLLSVFPDVLYNDNPTKEAIRKLAAFIRSDPNRFLVFYHGTSIEHPIMKEGLLPTSPGRARSYSSTSGYVYLSLFPETAKMFGEISYPSRKIVVYSVEVPARRILADKDQLYFVRREKGIMCGETVAESLVYGHGVRVRGKIDPMLISEEQPKRIVI